MKNLDFIETKYHSCVKFDEIHDYEDKFKGKMNSLAGTTLATFNRLLHDMASAGYDVNEMAFWQILNRIREHRSWNAVALDYKRKDPSHIDPDTLSNW